MNLLYFKIHEYWHYLGRVIATFPKQRNTEVDSREIKIMARSIEENKEVAVCSSKCLP